MLLLFVLLPAVELAILIEIGSNIGTLSTFLWIFGTGAIGASVAKQQGLATLQRIQVELSAGQLPAAALVDGGIILVAGALLLTPGLLTDLAGLACLVPSVRGMLRRSLRKKFASRIVMRPGVVDMDPRSL